MKLKPSILISVVGLLMAFNGCGKKPAVASWSNGNANGGVGGQFVNDVGVVPGKVGQAFAFDGGSNYLEVTSQPSLNLTKSLTIAFWAKRTAPGLHIIVEKGGDWTTGKNSYSVCLNDNYLGGVFSFNFTGGWRGCHFNPDSEWHHYAVVASQGQPDAILYVDGSPQTVTLRAGPTKLKMKPTSLPLHIGAQIDPNFNYFSKTLIDGLSIYNHTLSSRKIQSLYTAGNTGKN